MARWLVALIAALAGVVDASAARACGGFFCAGGGGPTPVVQAAERVMFEERDDGTIRAYVHIQYNQQGGAPIGFSWIIPVTSLPEIGVGDAATFDQMDQATAPQFQFLNAPVASGGGSGPGCGFGAASDARSTAGGTGEEGGVRVWDESRVGDYQTAIISGESADEIRRWLVENGYDIPDEAEGAIDHYVFTGHLFAAFRYAPINGGTGTLPPVVLTYHGDKPCVPIRITAIASMPILDIMVLAFGSGRARPDGEYVEVVPDYDAIRFDFTQPTGTTYTDEVDGAIERIGRHAWVVEHASTTDALTGISDPEAQALLTRNAYVTRFYTRMTPQQMDVDPEFIYEPEVREDVSRLHVIDLGGGAVMAALSTPEDSSMAAVPFGIVGLSGLTLLFRRRR